MAEENESAEATVREIRRKPRTPMEHSAGARGRWIRIERVKVAGSATSDRRLSQTVGGAGEAGRKGPQREN